MLDRTTTRRAFLAASASLTATVHACDLAFATEAPPPLHRPDQKGLDDLMAGNARFAADKAVCPPLTARRLELAEAQHPFAIVLSCSDSRVPVDTVFDQIPGNIFGIRIAGNFVDDDGLASIEYGVEILKSSLLLVLGHTGCGAIKATVEYAKNGTKEPLHIQRLVEAVLPAVTATKGKPGDWAHNAEIQNVKDNMKNAASRSAAVRKSVEEQTLSLAGGIYDLKTGRVTIVT